jgi:hypothetical protein
MCARASAIVFALVIGSQVTSPSALKAAGEQVPATLPHQIETTRLPKQTSLERRLRTIGFEDDRESFMLVKRYMVLKDLCLLLHCKPEDFKPAAGTGNLMFPLVGFLAPAHRTLNRANYACYIWFADPQNKNPGDAEVHVGFFIYGSDETIARVAKQRSSPARVQPNVSIDKQ